VWGVGVRVNLNLKMIHSIKRMRKQIVEFAGVNEDEDAGGGVPADSPSSSTTASGTHRASS
jgi:hypothetical protein